MLNKPVLKLRVNKDYGSSNSPQYSLKYLTGKLSPRVVSFSILSRLIGDNDVIILLSTDLLQHPWDSNTATFDKFLHSIRSIGLPYKQKNMLSAQNITIFGLQMRSNKKVEIQNLAVYVPNRVWVEHFCEILPVCGARYYVPKVPLSQLIGVVPIGTNNINISATDDTYFTERIFDMTKEEKAKAFSLDIFDLILAGQMGITSYEPSLDELRRRLGL
jgi:hypothetical protein